MSRCIETSYVRSVFKFSIIVYSAVASDCRLCSKKRSMSFFYPLALVSSFTEFVMVMTFSKLAVKRVFFFFLCKTSDVYQDGK